MKGLFIILMGYTKLLTSGATAAYRRMEHREGRGREGGRERESMGNNMKED